MSFPCTTMRKVDKAYIKIQINCIYFTCIKCLMYLYIYNIILTLFFFFSDYSIKKISEKKNEYLQLNKAYLMNKHLTAHEQKNLSRRLEISEKTIRLFFRKKRDKGNKPGIEHLCQHIEMYFNRALIIR